METLATRWFDYILKNVDDGIGGEKPVKIFVMGTNVWRDEDEWPLTGSRVSRFYLHSRGKATSLTGDGMLSATPPERESPDHFVYDPGDPVPTMGSATGARDQRPVEARSDVLVYTTTPFQKAMEVTEPISAEIYASSSAVDTDFTAKLVDIWPNGYAQNLTDGIIRARYRNSFEKPEFMNPGQIYKFLIDLWATSNVFLPGHRLRLEISSSNFPRFNRNLNTGEDLLRATRMMKATDVIYHDRDHTSALILPIIGGSPRKSP
jgi:putative CocE/NonD family hydrolase